MWTQSLRAGARIAGVVLAASLLGAAPAALAAGSTPSAVQLAPVELNPKPVGRTTDLVAQVTPSDATGTVAFFDDQDGVRTPIGSAPVVDSPLVLGLRVATVTLPADMAAATYHVVADHSGDDTYAPSESAPLDVTVGPRPSTTTLTVTGPHDASGATAQQSDKISVQVQVHDAGQYTPNAIAITGTVRVQVDGVDAGAALAAPFDGMDLPTAGWTLGTHAITATFEPNDADYSSSVSTVWDITIVPNIVDVSGVGVQYATFYPYKDGYRDTDAIRGTRNEPAKVAIRIYSSTGKLVRYASIAQGTGAWSFAWNGRSTSGAALAAGKYTVRQTVTDAQNLSKVFTSSITISQKRLYTYTVTLRKNATTQVTKKAADGSWFGWGFTLPSATVYKKLVFAAYGKTGSPPPGAFGPHNFSVCPSTSTWSPQAPNYCMTPWVAFPASPGWKSVTGSVTNNRHGTYVRIYAVGGNNTSVAYVRVTVTYAVLR
jgi:hypothetical protein